jgi:hypothetical protein
VTQSGHSNFFQESSPAIKNSAHTWALFSVHDERRAEPQPVMFVLFNYFAGSTSPQVLEGH